MTNKTQQNNIRLNMYASLVIIITTVNDPYLPTQWTHPITHFIYAFIGVNQNYQLNRHWQTSNRQVEYIVGRTYLFWAVGTFCIHISHAFLIVVWGHLNTP